MSDEERFRAIMFAADTDLKYPRADRDGDRQDHAVDLWRPSGVLVPDDAVESVQRAQATHRLQPAEGKVGQIGSGYVDGGLGKGEVAGHDLPDEVRQALDEVSGAVEIVGTPELRAGQLPYKGLEEVIGPGEVIGNDLIEATGTLEIGGEGEREVADVVKEPAVEIIVHDEDPDELMHQVGDLGVGEAESVYGQARGDALGHVGP
ncbi:hypothetical protein [Streptomyces sp. SPB162]|uniref:hypothetical protein n=1 Tax=Streptomyces sp. SPB162 TaxID=2940560 RepID=UPI002406098D|nr:hypothetical protein [Streptomyces sp. SPB162]